MRFTMFKGKRGITPIIAIILLLLMTVAAAGAAFFFLSRIQGQMQGGVESFQGQIFETISSQAEIVSADYNTTTTILTFFIQNVGNNRLPLDNSTSTPTTTLIFKDAVQNVICSSDFSGEDSNLNCSLGCEPTDGKIEIGEIRKVQTMLAETACDDITDNNIYGEETLIFFQMDLSGVTTASGSFVK